MAKRKKVLVSGSRHWTNRKLLSKVLNDLKSEDQLFIIEGGADGADTMAKEWAAANGVPCAQVDALWGFYHRHAGPTRNGWMLELEPDLVVAFHDNIAESRGTKNMLEKAKKAKVPAWLFTTGARKHPISS